MTAEATEAKSLFHSPLGLFDFQAEGVARAYWAMTESSEPHRLVLWDTGIGKTVFSLACAAMLFEDDMVDHIVVVGEANKILDWGEDDTPRFTDLTVGIYAGSRRKKVLDAMPQVIVLSWQTGRNDICTFKPKSRSIASEGPFTQALLGKRVLLVFDEFSVMKNRSSKTYLAWEHLVKVLRRVGPEPQMLGLTATSVEKHPEDHFNACRIISPRRAPTVADFYRDYVKSWDLYDKPADWKNLTPSDCEPGVIPFNQVFAPITLRKRKTDPDVIDQFPSKMENGPKGIDLCADHRKIYDEVEDIFDNDALDETEQRKGFSLIRLLANHPAALLASKGQYAKQVVEAIGEDRLRGMEVAKVTEMLRWQESMAQQQTVIFTFYGQSVLPFLHQALIGEGYKVSINHGSLNGRERQTQKEAYLAGDNQIFLSSDAGAKGLNLGVGSGLLHYELPVLYATYEQRSNRVHRIDSKHPSVTIDSLVAKDTVEYPLAFNMLKRNQWAEKVQEADYDDWVGDPGEGFLRAHDRLALLRRGRQS